MENSAMVTDFQGADTEPPFLTSSPPSSTSAAASVPLVYSEPWDEVHAVQIPANAQPGKDFVILFLNNWMLKVKCPPDAAPGQTLLFFPPKRTFHNKSSRQRITYCRISEELRDKLPECSISKVVHARFYSSPNVQCFRNTRHDSASLNGHANQPNQDCKTPSLFAISVPSHIPTDSILRVIIMGQPVQVNCPPTKKPGEMIFLEIPNPWDLSTNSSCATPDHSNHAFTISSDVTYRESLQSRTLLDSKQDSCSTLNELNHSGGSTSSETPANDYVNSDGNQLEQSISERDDTVQGSANSNVNSERSDENRPSAFLQSDTSTVLYQQQDFDSNHTFEAVIPTGIHPGDNFPFIIAQNIQLMITCPPNAHPGERVQCHLPFSSLSGSPGHATISINQVHHSSFVDEIKMVYKGQQWMRPLRLSDMKFIWAPVEQENCVIESVDRFDMLRFASVRKLTLTDELVTSRMSGVITFIPASEAAMSSNVCIREGNSEDPSYREIFSARDIATAVKFDFHDKVAWFRNACSLLRVGFFHGHVRIQIRRCHLLRDSINAVMSLDQNDLKKVWRFSFIDENAIDAGGVSREWYDSVTKAMFDPSFGLWSSSASHQNKGYINPCSGECSKNHLRYFRFLGRVMGKALFDRHVISTHMIQSMYKHILGWPLTFSDLQSFDEDYYRHLKYLTTLGSDELNDLGLDFTVVDENLATKTVVELIPDGSKQNLSLDNLPDYLKACWVHKMFGRYKDQLCAYLLGFYDVIPEPLVTIFDFQELELVMCGVPFIDTEDWHANTVYTGLCEDQGSAHIISIWFWELVEEMDQDMRVRLLQFVTGCSGVPIGGFSLLQGNDGSIRCFTIHGTDEDSSYYPRSHTCFNRIDLPFYVSKETMKERLYTAVLFSKGFDME